MPAWLLLLIQLLSVIHSGHSTSIPEITDTNVQVVEQWLMDVLLTANQLKLNAIKILTDQASDWPSHVINYGMMKHHLSVLKSKYVSRIHAIKNHNTISKCIGFSVPNMHGIWRFEREIDTETESNPEIHPVAQIEVASMDTLNVLTQPLPRFNDKIDLSLHNIRKSSRCCVRFLYQEEEFPYFNPSETNIFVKDFYMMSNTSFVQLPNTILHLK